MKRLLFVTNRMIEGSKTGAYIASKRNYDILKEIEIDIEAYIIPNLKSNIKKLDNVLLKNRLENITSKEENKILDKLKKENYDIVFLDGSCFGYLSSNIKKRLPHIKIITFCHDINYFLYLSILKVHTKMNKIGFKFIYKYFYLLKLIINSEINEKKVFSTSDIIITFNKRDSKLLIKKYGEKNIIEIPMTFESKKIDYLGNKSDINRKFKILFVGVADHVPNIEGINFFIDKVLNKIDVELEIIGRGMEKYKQEFENKNKKVKVLGTVDNLDKYYINADAIISPIFSGGGMKIKTGEALAYWKTIFGTTEAFEGYELDYDKVGGLCDTPEEFIEKINNYLKWWKEHNKPKFNEYSKNIFKEKYSYESSIKKFRYIFNKLGNK